MQRLALALAISIVLTGCGGSGLETGRVSGIITHNGAPLANATVTFTPQINEEEREMDAPASNGTTDENGEYTLTVTSTGDRGALIGMHDVVIEVFDEEVDQESDEIDPNKETSKIPASEQTFEVKSGSNEANFDL